MKSVDISLRNKKAIQRATEYKQQDVAKTVHNPDFHKLRREFPYNGYIDINIGGDDFIMFSNNDDIVAQCFFWFGPNSYEALALNLFHSLAKKSKYIYDIGAFTGIFSLCAILANKNAEIVAFEPSRSTWERAKINFTVNQRGAVIELLNVALSDSVGTVKFHHYRGALALQAGASYVKKKNKQIHSTEVVTTALGDDIVKERGGIDLVKLDVEGAELTVLRGLEESIKIYKPVFIIEIEPNNFKLVESFFTDHGYLLKFVCEESNRLKDRHQGKNTVSNYFAVHNSKSELFDIKHNLNA